MTTIPKRRRAQREKKHRHVCQRFLERYGEELTTEDAEAIVYTIRTILNKPSKMGLNGTERVRQESRNRSIWLTCVKGMTAYFVYDQKQRKLVTSLRPVWVRWQRTYQRRSANARQSR